MGNHPAMVKSHRPTWPVILSGDEEQETASRPGVNKGAGGRVVTLSLLTPAAWVQLST
jgi:hypothetical protein